MSIDFDCPKCKTHYAHSAEIVKQGGRAGYEGDDLTQIVIQGSTIVFTCRCGQEIKEAELWKSLCSSRTSLLPVKN